MAKRHLLMMSEGEASGGGGGVAEAPAAAPAEAPAPAPATAAAVAIAATPAAAPAVAAAPAPAGKTLAEEGAPAAPKKNPADTAAYWPADWRANMSGGDEKLLKQLERYAAPPDLFKKARELENKIASGEYKKTLGKDATDKELAAWRKDNGVPEAADKYDLTGVKLGETDTAILPEILSAAHKHNLTPEAARDLVSVLPKVRGMIAEKQTQNDETLRSNTEEMLRSEWGADYRRHLNVIHGVLDSTMTQEMKSSFLQARLPDGSHLGSHPDVLKGLLSIALIKNPTGIVVPGASSNPMQGIADEKAKIEKVMREDRGTYNKSEDMQKRYRDLIEAEQRMK